MKGEKSQKSLFDRFHSGKEYKAYGFFGCHRAGDGKYVFRVWAPHAESVLLEGSFNGFTGQKMKRLSDGECFGLTLSAKSGDKYLYRILTRDGRELLKCDPYSFLYDMRGEPCSVVYDLPEPAEYKPIFEKSSYSEPINIYEVNLLSWKRRADGGYLGYSGLEKELVPYVKKMGYTHVEFMPVTEFPYDGSWGYQVTGYFCPTSRLGAPEEFQSLINAFHAEGIKVIIDWVPAHFPKDDFGLYEFDGEPLYESPLWDRMELGGWGTRRFDFGRGEIDSFLLSSAYLFFDIYRVDGLRVDAVASMLYLDYDRKNGDFTPNIYGDNRNLQAIEFLKKFNAVIKKDFPGALTVAEESTAFAGVTKSVEEGGLGFDFKWNLGWMNDTLFYCRQDPYFRNHHHEKLTFSLMYAFSERYILPLSHDEVVHVKGSILNKMWGEYADKFSGERLLLAYMYAHPGKKLCFMGYEVAQFTEWNYNSGVEFFLKKFEKHAKMTVFVRFLNVFYKSCRALYESDDSWKGFEWISVDDKFNNFLAFYRYSADGNALICAANFSGVDLFGYEIGVERGKYKIVLNTDDKRFGGAGKLKKRIFVARNNKASRGKGYALYLDIPRLTCMYMIKVK